MDVPVVYLTFQRWRELRGNVDGAFDLELRWANMVEDRRVAKVWDWHLKEVVLAVPCREAGVPPPADPPDDDNDDDDDDADEPGTKRRRC